MQAVTEPVIDLIESVGELGVGALLALETVLPPIPSEVILPFAGYAAATGRLDPVLAWAAATVAGRSITGCRRSRRRPGIRASGREAHHPRHRRGGDRRVSPEFELEGAQVRRAFELNGHGKLIPDLHRPARSNHASEHGGGCSRMALPCRHRQETGDYHQ